LDRAVPNQPFIFQVPVSTSLFSAAILEPQAANCNRAWFIGPFLANKPRFSERKAIELNSGKVTDAVLEKSNF